MVINAENQFKANQWKLINLVADYLKVPATHVRFTMLVNNSKLGLCIFGEYRKSNNRHWQPFQPMTKLHSQHPYRQQQSQQ